MKAELALSQQIESESELSHGQFFLQFKYYTTRPLKGKRRVCEGEESKCWWADDTFLDATSGGAGDGIMTTYGPL